MTPSRRQSIGGSLEAVRAGESILRHQIDDGCPRFLMRGLIKARALVLGFNLKRVIAICGSPTLRVPAATGWQREQCAGPVLDLIRRTPRPCNRGSEAIPFGTTGRADLGAGELSSPHLFGKQPDHS